MLWRHMLRHQWSPCKRYCLCQLKRYLRKWPSRPFWPKREPHSISQGWAPASTCTQSLSGTVHRLGEHEESWSRLRKYWRRACAFWFHMTWKRWLPPYLLEYKHLPTSRWHSNHSRTRWQQFHRRYSQRQDWERKIPFGERMKGCFCFRLKKEIRKYFESLR